MSPLAFRPDLLRSVRSNAVVGEFTVREALDVMLEGTGLVGNVTSSGVMVINRLQVDEEKVTDNEGNPTMKTPSRNLFGRMMLALGMALGSVQASAESESPASRPIEEIVVTARLKEERLQDVGASIAAMGGESIANEGISSFEDISRRTVGLEVIDRGPNQNDVGMRGISNGFLPGLSDTGLAGPLVSQFVDDVATAQATGSQRDMNYFDFERIEVVRGPQPTYFGEGSVGGTIRYVTRSPDLSIEGISDTVLKVSGSSTRDGGSSSELAIASSLVFVPGKFGVRLVGTFEDNAGFIDNPLLGLEDVNDHESVGARLVVLGQPTDRLSLRFSAFTEHDEVGEGNGVDPGAPEDALVINSPIDGDNEDDFSLFSGKVDYEFDAFTITSITGLFERDAAKEAYAAGSALGWGQFLPVTLSATTVTSIEEKSFTEELRISTNFVGPINFIAGAYYEDTELESNADTTAPEFGAFVVQPAASNVLWQQYNAIDTRQYSLFAEVTYEVSDRFRLIAGARFVDEDVRNRTSLSTFAVGGGASGREPPFAILNLNDLVEGSGLSNTATFNLKKWLPRVAVEYDISPDMMLYASGSTGIRNGNLNPSSSAFNLSGGDQAAFEEARFFSDDEVVSYEVGLKAQWRGGLTTNFALYRTDYADPQVQAAAPLVLAVNGPDERIVGVEVETQWRVSEFLDVYVNGSYVDGEFEGNQLISVAAPSLGFPFDLREGNQPSNTPELSISSGASLFYPLSGSLSVVGHLAFQYIDSRFTTVQNFPSSELDAQRFVNLRLGVEGEKWSAVLFATNATNELAFQSVVGGTGRLVVDANGELDFSPGTTSVNRPRQLGLDLRFWF